MKRSVVKLKYDGKYINLSHPDDRAFDMANSGMVFQGACLVDSDSSPLLALFYADASFSRQSMSHHPIYSTYFYCNYVHYIHYGHYIPYAYYFVVLQCVC